MDIEEIIRNLDYLEENWYNKLKSIGFDDMDAVLCARMKAQMERDMSLRDRIRQQGFDGFKRWAEIRCKDIYYAVKDALRSLWERLKQHL